MGTCSNIGQTKVRGNLIRSLSLREYDFRLVSHFVVTVLISAIVKKDFLSTFSDGR